MVPILANKEICQRKAKLAELKHGIDFGEYERLKFFRSDEPMERSGGMAYHFYIVKSGNVIHTSTILWDCI